MVKGFSLLGFVASHFLNIESCKCTLYIIIENAYV